MRIKTTLSLVIPALLLACTTTIDDKSQAENLFGMVIQKYLRHSSMAVNIDYYESHYDGEETYHINAFCREIRDKSDTIFGGKFAFSDSFAREIMYLGDKDYVFYNDSQTGIDYSSIKNRRWSLEEDAFGSVINFLFINPAKLNTYMTEAVAVSVVREDVPPFQTWKITLKFPDKKDDSDFVQNYWINMTDSVIIKRSVRDKFQGYYQYFEWNCSGYDFDKVSEPGIRKRADSLQQAYKMEIYVPGQNKKSEILANGTQAPFFTGEIYPEKGTYRLEEEKSKIVILDFWFRSCYWCIKAIPILDSIYQTYSDAGIMVLGINSIDNNERDLRRMDKFLQYNMISYPIILVDYKVDSLYRVDGYPTFLMLDSEKKIIFSQAGFSKSLRNKLDSIIQEELKLPRKL